MERNKTAIIFGVTGQDGSYLSEYLLSLAYKVIGVKRRSSTNNEERLSSVLNDKNFTLMEGDITDYSSISGIFSASSYIFGDAPGEVYNLAAQSHVGTSFKQPIATLNSDVIGVLNILEVIKNDYIEDTRFYQASTSEMFGDQYTVVKSKFGDPDIYIQNEDTPFNPQSPYSIAKTAAHHLVRLYRESYGLFGCCGILFNHESPRRGENFVTKKISKYVAKLNNALENGYTIDKLKLGNLQAIRDWGHAKDYVKAMHMVLNASFPDDYVVATGRSHSVEEFCKKAFDIIGQDYTEWVEVDEEFLRPSEVPYLRGDASRIKKELCWEPDTPFHRLVAEMVNYDIDEIKSNKNA